MKKSIFTIIFLFISIGLSAQELHTPPQIFKIMENSPITYELGELKERITVPDRSANLNGNQYYRDINENQISTFEYKVSEDVEELAIKAENLFMSRSFKESRELYLRVLEKDSTYYKILTYIGQTYGIEQDFDTAIKWYKKAIEKNYIDYMAHWFLADAYKMKGQSELAIEEITIAQILNRNNPRLKKSLLKLYKENKLKTDEWTFNPQMVIDSTGVDKVKIVFSPEWLGYAMVKSLWKYEPGYKESMGVERNSYSTSEEKEAFISLLTGFNKKVLKKNPEFRALQNAIDKDMIDAYIFYEIILPEHPIVAYQLTEEFIKDIKNYVIEIRGNNM